MNPLRAIAGLFRRTAPAAADVRPPAPPPDPLLYNALFHMAAGPRAAEMARVLAGAHGEERQDEARWALVENAEAFLRAGGVWTPGAWIGLSAAERGAADQAGRRFWAARAIEDGRAARGGLEAAGVQAIRDGGEAAEELLLERLLARVEG